MVTTLAHPPVLDLRTRSSLSCAKQLSSSSISRGIKRSKSGERPSTRQGRSPRGCIPTSPERISPAHRVPIKVVHASSHAEPCRSTDAFVMGDSQYKARISELEAEVASLKKELTQERERRSAPPLEIARHMPVSNNGKGMIDKMNTLKNKPPVRTCAGFRSLSLGSADSSESRDSTDSLGIIGALEGECYRSLQQVEELQRALSQQRPRVANCATQCELTETKVPPTIKKLDLRLAGATSDLKASEPDERRKTAVNRRHSHTTSKLSEKPRETLAFKQLNLRFSSSSRDLSARDSSKSIGTPRKASTPREVFAGKLCTTPRDGNGKGNATPRGSHTRKGSTSVRRVSPR
ncbi:hypothetical protein DIPPA_17673 [Diplonema papillatum]|nr:hypothetical protein DIPPA_17673 [Diplonema papillatum]